MSVQVRINGQWLSSIAPWGELNWSHNADGGCAEASWKMDLPNTYSHPALTRGKIVEIKVGPENVWKGVLLEPDVDDDWTFTAQGLSALAKDFLCFDASLNTTSKPNTAVDQAILRGLPWTKPNSLSSPAFAATDTTAELNYVADLLNAWSTSESKRWGVNADGEVYAQIDPTTPTWHLTPGAGRFGLADDDYASDLFIRYLTSGAGYATATVADTVARANFGRREYGVDGTPRGLLTSTQAAALGTGLLAKGKARLGYTNAVEVSRYQLTTPGGTPAYLPFVKAGDLVRMFGVRNEQGQPLNYVDWVIGETHYEAGSETIGLAPVGLVGRTLTDALSDLSSVA
jgi:hypothetical protein